ncbi:MAG: GNAT family N-acetyltransferase [Candidatus Thermoplasmatota archaeon]|nr:GNAT family N-acetyltransferase [Candidatus Thermoplasmatota archaeon]MDI6855438.1 GNAT family N-acetyltransferase [Candidatus Thermoplasmatota archaeon]
MEIRAAKESDRSALELLASENGLKFKSSIEHTLIAEQNGKIIGYVSYTPELKQDKWFGKHYETNALVVKEEYLGEGVVTKLIEEVTELAKSKGVNLKLRH